MTEKLKELATALFCADLGYVRKTTPSEIMALMESKLEQANQRLVAAGIAVEENTPADVDLLVCYAAWLYRSRINQQAMPVQLRKMLRERQADGLLGEASV